MKEKGDRMNILVSNDDGYQAEGVRQLAKSLSQVANIYLIAPEDQRSATSHAITIRKKLRVTEVDVPYTKMAMYINGSPADCVKLGLKILEEKNIKIDMVWTGINHGGNIGTDCHYSGTVGAAMEGCLNGIPSVAMSIDNHYPDEFETAGEVALEVFKKTQGKFGAEVMINVNVPNLPKEEIKGIKIVREGIREYDNWFTSAQSDEEGRYYMYSGQPRIYKDLSEDLDVMAVQDGYISVVPTLVNWTYEEKLETLKKLGLVYG